jgi:hypothetical protein
MSSEDIDKIFREGTQASYPYDEALWNQVEASLPANETKRRGFYYWIIAAAALLALFTISWFTFYSAEPDEKLYLPRTVAQFEEAEKLEKAKETDSFTSQASALKMDPEFKGAEERSPAEDPKTSSGVASNTDQKKRIESNSVNQKLEDRTTNAIANIEEEDPSEAINERAYHNATESNSAQKNEPPAIYSPIAETQRKDPENLMEVGSISEKQSLGHLNLMAALGLNQEPLSHMAKKGEPLKNYPKPVREPILLEFQYNNALSLQNRNSSESAISSQQFAILGIKEKKNISYGAGLRYARFRERFSYRIDNERIEQITEYDTNVVVVNSGFTQNGIPVWLVKDEIRSTSREERVTESSIIAQESVLNSVQLPIFIGYQKPIGRFEVGGRGSMVVNYVYRSSGAYYDATQQQYIQLENASGSEALFINLEADARFGFQLNEYSKIGANYRYQYALNELAHYNGALMDGGLIGIWIQHQFR